MNRCVIFAANRGYALKSSREGIIRRFLDNGWYVVLATADDYYSRALVQLGAELEPVRFSRGGLAPVVDWRAWRRMRNIVRKHRPVLMHNFHAKPVILGSMAARRELGDGVRVVNSITGLGHAFVQGGWISHLAGAGYRRALGRSDIAIFQNRDDLALFLENGWVDEKAARLVIGSGVDVQRFIRDRQHQSGRSPVVVMLGRLIWQKGVKEFAEVARRVRKRYSGARFLWAGESDQEHPDAVPEEWVRSQTDFEYLGRINNVPELLQRADVLLFPSSREGVPRAVMEAAASGIPTVGFDVPGVREAVHDGKTGFLIPERDVDALTDAVIQLIERPELRQRLGSAGRRLAEAAFDIQSIEAAHFSIYQELGIDVTDSE